MIANEGATAIDDRTAVVRRAMAGERAALEALLRDVWPSAYRIAWSVLRNRVAAEDAAQDACAQVAAKLTALRAPEAFAIWFYRIVVRAATRYHATPLESLPETLSAQTPALEDRLDLGEQIVRLPQALRLTIVLRYYLDCNSTEIGAILGIPPATVRFRLAAARSRLRIALTGRPAGEPS